MDRCTLLQGEKEELDSLLDQVLEEKKEENEKKKDKLKKRKILASFYKIQEHVPTRTALLKYSFDMYEAPKSPLNNDLFYIQHTGDNNINLSVDPLLSCYLLRKSTRVFLKMLFDFSMPITILTTDKITFKKRLVLRNTFLYDQMFQMLIFKKRDVDGKKQRFAALQFLASYNDFLQEPDHWSDVCLFALKPFLKIKDIESAFCFCSNLHSHLLFFNPNDLKEHVIFRSF